MRKYKAEGFHVTACDIGTYKADLVFAIKVRSPIDLYYMGDLGLGAPMWDEKAHIIYFPEVKMNAQAYGEMIDARS